MRETIFSVQIFDDKIKNITIAKEFNEMTRAGKRKNMCMEAYKIWARMMLKQIIKPGFFIMVSGNNNNINACIYFLHIFIHISL